MNAGFASKLIRPCYGQVVCETTIYLWREDRFCRIFFLGSFSFLRIFVVPPQLSISEALKVSKHFARSVYCKVDIKPPYLISIQVQLLAWNYSTCGVATNPTPNAHDGQLVQAA